MAEKPLTIDNLGPGASQRYAEDQKLFDATFIEESSAVSKRSEISVLTPYIPSEFDLFFSVVKNQRWAFFEPPPGYNLSGSLFTHQVIPSFGDPETIDIHLQKLQDLQKKRKKKETQAEIQSLIQLLHDLQTLDKTLGAINARRNQYQRG